MDNKELLDKAIEVLESLRDKKLRCVRVETMDDHRGESNLCIDIDYFYKSRESIDMK